MKFLSTLVFAAATTTSVTADNRDCTPAESSTAYLALINLLSGPDLAPCAADSGYDMLNAKGLPTDSQYGKMCVLSSCKGLIKSVIAKNPPNCVLLIPTSQAKLNVYELANGFDGVCARVISGSTTAPTSGVPTTAPTTAPVTQTPATQTPGTPTTAPVTSSPAPVPTKVAC